MSAETIWTKPCNLGRYEYDGARHCGEHGGFVEMYAGIDCDRAQPTANHHHCGDPQCPDWQGGDHYHLANRS